MPGGISPRQGENLGSFLPPPDPPWIPCTDFIFFWEKQPCSLKCIGPSRRDAAGAEECPV